MSSDLIWCVRAPTEMKSTPVSAYSRSVASVMPPLDSVSQRPVRGEIVEHDAVHASCGEHFVDVFERTHFAFDRNVLAFCLEIGFGSFDGRADAACKVYVVVLQQNHVEQSHAVILTAADLDGHLVQYAHARGGFARVENFGMQVFDLVGIDGCLGRHAAHALHDVQQDAFGLQQGLEPSRNVEGHVARLHAVAVAEDLFELHVGVQASKHQLCDFDARENTLLFAEQAHAAFFRRGDAAERSVVAVADVFADGQFDERIDERFVFGFHIFSVFMGETNRFVRQGRTNV